MITALALVIARRAAVVGPERKVGALHRRVALGIALELAGCQPQSADPLAEGVLRMAPVELERNDRLRLDQAAGIALGDDGRAAERGLAGKGVLGGVVGGGALLAFHELRIVR